MNITNIRNIRPSGNLLRKVMAICLSIFVIIFSYVLLNNVGKAARDTIMVIRVKSEYGVPAKIRITADMLEKYALIKKEYDPEMLTYDQLDKVVGRYTLYPVRKDGILYKDQLTENNPVSCEWLYKLDISKEALTLPFNYLECGGSILRPGDKVRIRLTARGATNGIRNAENTVKPPTDKGNVILLFECITVRDLLNASGDSIYEVINEVQKLNDEKRATVQASSKYQQSIQPRSLVLEATPEQVQRYAQFLNSEDKVFTITLLSRMDNKDIMDIQSNVEKEVSTWGMTEE